MFHKKLFAYVIIWLMISCIQTHAAQEPLKPLRDKLENLGRGLGSLKGKLTELKESIGTLKGKLSGLVTVRQLPTFSQQKLDDLALTQGYGYKAANLTLLEEIATELRNIDDYTVAVPPFIMISSNEIQEFLKTTLGFDIQQKWQALMAQFSGVTEQQNQNPQSAFPTGFLAQLETIVTKPLATAFDAKLSPGQQQSPPPSITADAITRLTTDASGKKFLLVVRSTGKEDTDNLANAGGNETVINVEATPEALLAAIKKVVCSYVSPKSLQQRLGAKDPTLYDAPFTPVIIQRMISEPVGGINNIKAIPRVGVMFTEEPEGSINKTIKREPGTRIPTTGITLIQASYGLNEGVVNSLVPVDSFYVDRTGMLYEIIRKKPTRLVPADLQGNHIHKPNHPTLMTLPALTLPAIHTLKKIADDLENYYGKPMDIEYLVDEDKKIIYLLQARPIVHPQNLVQPAYINDLADPRIAATVSGEAIGTAGGGVHFIDNPDQLLIKQTIGEALNIFNAAEEKKQFIKAVIIGTPAPTTSHEATQFRTEKKPVIFIENYATIEQWLTQPKTLIIDTQQATVAQLTERFQLDALAGLITKGWKHYPVALTRSVTINQQPEQQQSLEKKIAALGLTPEAYRKLVSDLDPKIDIQKFRESLTTLSTATDQGVISTCLATIIILFLKAIRPYKDVLAFYPHLTAEMHKLIDGFFVCAQAIKHMPADAPGMQRRFPVRMLEALIFQETAQRLRLGIQEPSSFVSFISHLHSLKKAAKETIPQQLAEKSPQVAPAQKPSRLRSVVQKIIREPNRQRQLLTLLTEYAISDVVSTSWTTFVQGLPAAQITQLAELINFLAPFNILELWLHTSFIDAWDAAGNDASQCLTALLDEKNQSQEFLQELNSWHTRLLTLNTDNAQDPEKFMRGFWEPFMEVVAYATSQKFMNTVRETKLSLEKLAATNFCQQLVDTFDTAIKTLESSDKFEVKADPTAQDSLADGIAKKLKLIVFKHMLLAYMKLLQTWYGLNKDGLLKNNLLPYKMRGQGETVYKNVEKFIQEKFKHLTNKIITIDNKEELIINDKFSVNEIIIGAGGSWLRCKITSLEEYFTFIHQSLLVILTTLNKELFINKIETQKYSSVISKIVNAASKQQYLYLSKNQLLGISINNGIITLHYNLPQNNHSAKVAFSYHAKKDSCTITFYMFGEDHNHRWAIANDFIKSISKLLNLPCTTILQPREIECTWIVAEASTSLVPLLNEQLFYVMDTALSSSGNIKRFANTIGTENFFYKELISKFIEIIIDLSNPAQAKHVHFFLQNTLNAINANNDFYQDFLTKTLDVETLINICKAALDKQSDYSKATRIFFAKTELNPMNYNLNVDNMSVQQKTTTITTILKIVQATCILLNNNRALQEKYKTSIQELLNAIAVFPNKDLMGKCTITIEASNLSFIATIEELIAPKVPAPTVQVKIDNDISKIAATLGPDSAYIIGIDTENYKTITQQLAQENKGYLEQCSPGNARHIAFKKSFKVIFAKVKNQEKKFDATLLTQGINNALKLATDLKLKHVYLPVIGSSGLSTEGACKATAVGIKNFLNTCKNPTLENITIFAYDANEKLTMDTELN